MVYQKYTNEMARKAAGMLLPSFVYRSIRHFMHSKTCNYYRQMCSALRGAQ